MMLLLMLLLLLLCKWQRWSRGHPAHVRVLACSCRSDARLVNCLRAGRAVALAKTERAFCCGRLIIRTVM